MATALAADLRYAADDAVFAIPARRLGLGYHMAGLEALSALVGPAAAKEMLFSARRYDAAEARALGLVNAVYPKAELEREVRALAATMADNAPFTLRAAKLALRELARDAGARDVAAVRRAILACFESDDYREGVRAFSEAPARFAALSGGWKHWNGAPRCRGENTGLPTGDRCGSQTSSERLRVGRSLHKTPVKRAADRPAGPAGGGSSRARARQARQKSP